MAIRSLLERNALQIAIAVSLLVLVTSLMSISSLGITSSLSKLKNSDKYAHFIAYFTLTLSWMYAQKYSPKVNINRYLLIALLVLFGIIIEALQGGITTYRTADVKDVLANSGGIFFATILFKRLHNWFNSVTK